MSPTSGQRTTQHKNMEVWLFASASDWWHWLEKNCAQQEGIWLQLAKKNGGGKSISYEEAREAAICFGWIDGLINRWDEQFYLVRFGKRRPRSLWSKINRGIAESLMANGKMQEPGRLEVEAAQRDGRFAAAYDSSTTMQVPPLLEQGLNDHPQAAAAFAKLDAANRYAFLFRIQTARTEKTRQKWVERTLEMLLAGETFHPPGKQQALSAKASGSGKVASRSSPKKKAASRKTVRKKK